MGLSAVYSSTFETRFPTSRPHHGEIVVLGLPRGVPRLTGWVVRWRIENLRRMLHGGIWCGYRSYSTPTYFV